MIIPGLSNEQYLENILKIAKNIKILDGIV